MSSDSKIYELHPHGPGNFEDPQKVLDEVKADKPSRVIVIYEADGYYHTHTNIEDGAIAVFLLEWAKLRVMKAGADDLWVKP